MRAVERRMEDVFGPYAGWAHNALFIAELSDVRKTLPEHLRTPKRTPTTPKTKTKRKIVDTVVDTEPDDDDEPFESPSKPVTRDDG